jgi:hypothetical protein
MNAMDDAVRDATAEGFILGLQVAEHLHGVALGSTLAHGDFVGLMLDVAGGKPLPNENVNELVKAIPGDLDIRTKQQELQAASEQAARRLMEWYRRQFMA